ncbi:hypothetical protein NQ317_004289 [Molorchus minor]|uniref:Peptidase S1 domain-containing protein n=1 Tax=Molorchus minor TaxID=1323400 RepID=A0ABQ9JFH9_9CUCU|nr:hypothetical protein NQ317_004289 [Molorchus minor]
MQFAPAPTDLSSWILRSALLGLVLLAVATVIPGGPLVVNEVQVGVASFVSARGCESGLPTGYARVSSFRNWIADNAGI